jgi:hypothetical protein
MRVAAVNPYVGGVPPRRERCQCASVQRWLDWAIGAYLVFAPCRPSALV